MVKEKSLKKLNLKSKNKTCWGQLRDRIERKSLTPCLLEGLLATFGFIPLSYHEKSECSYFMNVQFNLKLTLSIKYQLEKGMPLKYFETHTIRCKQELVNKIVAWTK